MEYKSARTCTLSTLFKLYTPRWSLYTNYLTYTRADSQIRRVCFVRRVQVWTIVYAQSVETELEKKKYVKTHCTFVFVYTSIRVCVGNV